MIWFIIGGILGAFLAVTAISIVTVARNEEWTGPRESDEFNIY